MSNKDSPEMVRSLVKHLFFERILPVLPVESYLKTYGEVEANETFLMCRSVIMDVSVAQDVNAVVEETITLIELILREGDIIGENISPEAVQSILALIRLLSDSLEYFWDHAEVTQLSKAMGEALDDVYERQKRLFSGSMLGYSTHRPCFHSSSPAPLKSELATRLLETCTRIKFNTESIRMLKDMSFHLYGSTSIVAGSILPAYQAYLKDKNHPSYAEKVDLTVDYILRFLAASNPTEFTTYLKIKVLKPLLENHVSIEIKVIQHLNLFGCVFLSRKNLTRYLETIKNLSNTMKKSIYHCLLLYYASKALTFWMMARPKEYTEIFRYLKDSRSSEVSTPDSDANSHSTTASYNEEVERCKAISQLASSIFDDIYSSFNISTLLSAVNSYHSNSTPQSASSSFTQSPSQFQAPPSAAASFPSSGPFSPPLYSTIPQSSTPPSLTNLSGMENSPQQSSSETLGKSSVQDSNVYPTSIEDSPSHTKRALEVRQSRTSGVPHLKNILDLYTTADSSESLSHSSVLKFLTTLVVLDMDVFTELNATCFRNIADPRKGEENASEVEEKEKIQGGIRHLTHGLKRLTTLPVAKKKGIKFMTMLMRNLGGSLLVTDTAFLDTMRALLTFFTVSSSFALVDDTIPSVVFAKRLFPALALNLDLGKDWNSEAKINPYLQKCLLRHPRFYGRSQIEVFAAAIQLDQSEFLDHLHLEELTANLSLKKLSLYTEGFRIFFRLPSTRILRKGTAKKTSGFFKSLLFKIPDTLMKSFPYFDDRVADIVTSILDGSIIEELGERNLFLSCSQSSTSSFMSSSSPSQSTSGPSPPGGMNIDMHLIGHPLGWTQSNNSSSSDTSSTNLPVGQTDHQFSHLVAPRAHRVSGTLKKNLLFSSPSGLDSERGQQATRTHTEVMQDSPSNITRNARSPLSQARSRRASDENYAKASNHFSITENLLNTALEEYDDARRIMINIFSIFKRLTNYFIIPRVERTNEKWASADFRNIIKPIFVAIIDSDDNLQQTAESFMDVLINYIPSFSEGSSQATIQGYYYLCSYTVALFSTALFDLKLTNNKREVVLHIIVKFLKVRTHLAKMSEGLNFPCALLDAESETFPLISGTLGRALMMSLFSNKSSVQKLLKTAYGEFYQVIKFHEKTVGSIPAPWLDNLGFAGAMSQDNYVTSGSVAFQRRLRLNILKFIKRPDAILLDSMEVIYKKWLSLSRSKLLSQEELADFRSFAGILASMCGVLLAIGDENSPHLKDLRVQVTTEMDVFIKKQCQWLNHPDLLTRENSRDILSTELHPLAFNLLFSNLKAKIDDLSSVDLSQSDHDLSFVLLEQVIIILRTILRRDDDDKILLLFSLDVINFIDQLVEIVNKIPYESAKFYKAIIHMSKMFRAFEVAEKYLAVTGHYELKNKWLKLVTNWFNLTVDKDYDLPNLAKPHREMDLKRRDFDYLYIDTLIESSRALAFLTQDVPLEIAPSVSEEELRRSRFVVFGNYFSILLKGLEKSTDIEKFPASLKHKISILNENVITALTNLSNANVEAGFQHSLPMGYQPKNKSIRLAFLKVFINIVSNYQAKKNPSVKLKMAAMDEVILHLIKHPYLVLKTATICPPADIEACAAGLVNAFDARNASYILVKDLVAEEIKNAPRHMDILRRNSIATRALSLFSRLKGNEYLVRTLNPVLSELLDKGEFFEIEKAQPDSKKQVALFVKYMKKLVDAITNSIPFFPPELLIICQTIYESVNKKFPDYTYVAVGSFVFLRFVCPALVSPESENIVDIPQPQCKRPFITLAKVIQSIANGSDNLAKWPLLEPEADFLKDCSCQIFDFLKDVCRTDRTVSIPVNLDPHPVSYEFNFLHRYFYTHELEIRRALLEDYRSFSEFESLKYFWLMIDRDLAVLGQPKMEFKNEIPSFIKDNMDEYPQLYEFMSSHAFRDVGALNSGISFAHESMSADGLPILTLTFRRFSSNGDDVETVVYRTFQIYARIWTSKHFLVLDCTEFDEQEIDVKKLTSLFASLLPPIALKNCKGYFYFNIGENFMNKWGRLLGQSNPYITHSVPQHFVNSYTDPELAKSLGLSGQSLEVLQDVRVTLNDVTLYDSKLKRFTPISLKIGNKYFLILHETSKHYKIQGWDKLLDIKFNDVYEIGKVTSVDITSTTGVKNEFTVNLTGSRTLVFSSSKYLEIVKLFYYALDRIEEEYVNEDQAPATKHDVNERENLERYDILCHIFLNVWVGLCGDDDVIRSVAYNLLAVTQETFNVDCGSHFRQSPEVYVLNYCCTFGCLISEALARTAPELTAFVFKYFLEAIENKMITQVSVPQTIACLSYWTPNIYKDVYRVNAEEGPEAASRIIRALIRLTVSDPSFTTLYVQQIWLVLVIEGSLTPLIVEELINHALDRDSEGRDWSSALSILNESPTIDMASLIIGKLMKIIKSFLPSLKLEASTHSWSELLIVVNMSIPIFFENTLITQMFLPETLFIISLLIDVGPTKIRTSLHALLMNVSHSLTLNDAITEEQKRMLDEVCTTLSRQRSKFMFGFSQDKGRVLQNFSAASFASKFAALEHFITSLMRLIDCSSVTEAPQWKTRFKKYLIDTVFNSDSFLSARAMMILGIVGKTSTSESLCRHLLCETMKVIAEPQVTDELIFLQIAHIFTYSKLVQGIDTSLDLLKQLFWLSAAVVESPHPVVFEGGLLFMSNTLACLYQSHFESKNDEPSLTSTLIRYRNFANTLLEELESLGGAVWDEQNFTHNTLALFSRGLSISTAKSAALESLQSLFGNSYREHGMNPESRHYLCYMFFLYLFLAPEQFTETLRVAGIEDEMVDLHDNNKIPKVLADWLSSDKCCPNITLYQGAILFSSSVSDEPCKLKFALIMRFLMKARPTTIFRIYVVVREELRRIAALDLTSDCVAVSFDIIRLLVKYPEFNNMEKFHSEIVQTIKQRGLQAVTKIDEYDQSSTDLFTKLEANADLIYNRKRLITMILSRMTCFV